MQNPLSDTETLSCRDLCATFWVQIDLTFHTLKKCSCPSVESFALEPYQNPTTEGFACRSFRKEFDQKPFKKLEPLLSKESSKTLPFSRVQFIVYYSKNPTGLSTLRKIVSSGIPWISMGLQLTKRVLHVSYSDRETFSIVRFYIALKGSSKRTTEKPFMG